MTWAETDEGWTLRIGERALAYVRPTSPSPSWFWYGGPNGTQRDGVYNTLWDGRRFPSSAEAKAHCLAWMRERLTVKESA